jgi:hypothetical protein
MRNLASDKDGMQHARKCQISDELPASGQEAAILPALH